MQVALPSGKPPRQGRLGPGDYATNSFLPPISFANMLFVQALIHLVPEAIQDARRERYQWLVEH